MTVLFHFPTLLCPRVLFSSFSSCHLDAATTVCRLLAAAATPPHCNTPDVYIPLDNEYGFKHEISVNKSRKDR